MDLSVFIKNNPKNRATNSQVDFAKLIADALELDEPDYNSFDDTYKFISENVEEYRML